MYVETTVVSYLTARPSRDLVLTAHQELTQEWWDRCASEYDLYASQLVVQEASAGDPEAAAKRLEIVRTLQLLIPDALSVAIARGILDSHCLAQTAADDALHIGISASAGIDYLLTWNCKHIANAAIRGDIESACRLHGVIAPTICTPMELME